MTYPQLQELTITLRLTGFLHTSVTVCSELDLLLEAPQFVSTLRVFAIRFRHLTTYLRIAENAEQMTTSRFPLSAARGILRVEFLGYLE
jgi:hypothetical protein